MKKTLLRQQMLEKRLEISPADLQDISTRICKNIEYTEWFINASALLFFASHKNEPNLFSLAEKYISQKTVCFPRVVDKHSKLQGLDIVPVQSMDDFFTGAYGILEPSKKQILSPRTLDVILVPAVAIDPAGNRIGYGGGYYDRLLPNTNAITIGVVPACNILQASFSTEKHDIPLHGYVTEEEVKTF